MAGIKEIVDELSTTADAFGKSFSFEEVSEVNWKDRSATFPHIACDSRSVEYTVIGRTGDYLPRKVRYTLNIHFYDRVRLDDTTDKQTDYDDVETIADQFVAQLFTRTIDNDLGFYISSEETDTGFTLDLTDSDTMARTSRTLSFIAEKQCTTGSFSY